MQYTYHELVDAGNGVYKMAVGNTRDEFFESIFRIKAEAKGYKPPEMALTEKPLRLFGEYADEWLRLYANVLENTNSRYVSKINVLKEFFGKMPLIAIQPKDAQTFFNGRADYALSYNRDLKNILSQILDSAKEDGYVERNVAKSTRVHVKGKPTKEREPLTADEQRKLIELIPQIQRVEDRLFLGLAFYTGMRPSEAYGLMWEDIDWDVPSIHVQRNAPIVHGRPHMKEPKTKAGNRIIPMTDGLLKLLEPLKGTGLIIHDRTGRPFTEQMRKLQRKRIRKLTGKEALVPYDLRHTAITRMVEAGVGIKATQTIAGHADTRPTLDIYAHTTPEMLTDASMRIDATFEKIASGA